MTCAAQGPIDRHYDDGSVRGRTLRLAALLLALPVLAACAASTTPAPSSDEEENRAVVSQFARLFYTERDVATAFETYVAEDYIQHNPGVTDGRQAAISALAPMFAEDGRAFNILQILIDGDMAVIHVHAIPEPGVRGASVFDMYRLEDGKIVEHWDAIQPVPENSANAHPMF